MGWSCCWFARLSKTTKVVPWMYNKLSKYCKYLQKNRQNTINLQKKSRYKWIRKIKKRPVSVAPVIGYGRTNERTDERTYHFYVSSSLKQSHSCLVANQLDIYIYIYRYMKFFIIFTSTQSINKFRYRRRIHDTSKSPQPAHQYSSTSSEASYHQMNLREAHRRRWKVLRPESNLWLEIKKGFKTRVLWTRN